MRESARERERARARERERVSERKGVRKREREREYGSISVFRVKIKCSIRMAPSLLPGVCLQGSEGVLVCEDWMVPGTRASTWPRFRDRV